MKLTKDQSFHILSSGISDENLCQFSKPENSRKDKGGGGGKKQNL